MDNEIYAYIIQLKDMNNLLKLAILVGIFRPEIYKTVISWIKYLWNNRKLEKIRSLIKFTVNRGQYSKADFDASIEFTALIERERLRASAMNANYAIFHNSLSAGFRNYSCRVESVREMICSWLGKMQQLPLSPFEKIINRFESEPVQIIDVTDEVNDYNATVILNLKELNATRLILVPAVIPVKDAYPGFKYSLKRKINGVESYILGMLSITLDEKSDHDTKQDIITHGKDITAQMLSMYIANPKTLIK